MPLFRLVAIQLIYINIGSGNDLVPCLSFCQVGLSSMATIYFHNLGYFFFSAVVNQHLTCVNECTFMPICIAYYMNTCISAHFGEGAGGFLHVKNWKNLNWYCTNGLVPKDARACICTFLEHHFIDDDPFQPVQQWFSWNYISKYSYFFFFFFYELLCSDTLFSSCWRHMNTFFINPLFFHFLLQLVSCPVFLN